MPPQPNPADPPISAAPLPPYDVRYLRLLDNLLDVSEALARRIQQEAEPAPGPSPTTKQLVADYDTLSETVRRNITLARHIHQQLPEPAAKKPQPIQGPPQRTAARKRIIREVQDAILREGRTEQAEALYTEFLERLEMPDLDEEILTRPIPDIIADICRDLSVVATPNCRPFARRTPHDIAQLCALAAEPPIFPEPPDPFTIETAADPPTQTSPPSPANHPSTSLSLWAGHSPLASSPSPAGGRGSG